MAERNSIRAPRRVIQVGEVFGRLTVLSPGPSGIKGKARWNCVCFCGENRLVYATHLIEQRSKSCGCLNREILDAMTTARNTVHGKSGTVEHWAWKGMISRCYRVNGRYFANYGGRGITVCDRWRHSFSAFLEDMGHRPSPAHSLDRKDNNGNYEPGNCRWATRTEQNRNRRCVHKASS